MSICKVESHHKYVFVGLKTTTTHSVFEIFPIHGIGNFNLNLHIVFPMLSSVRIPRWLSSVKIFTIPRGTSTPSSRRSTRLAARPCSTSTSSSTRSSAWSSTGTSPSSRTTSWPATTALAARR